MGAKRIKPPSAKATLPFKTDNKFKRQDLHVKQKKARDSLRRDERFRRKREEDRDPELRRERLARNVPITIDKKRVWDEVDGDGLNVSVDVEQLKRRRIEAIEATEAIEQENSTPDDDADSMLDSEESSDEEDKADRSSAKRRQRAASNAPSTTSTNL